MSGFIMYFIKLISINSIAYCIFEKEIDLNNEFVSKDEGDNKFVGHSILEYYAVARCIVEDISIGQNDIIYTCRIIDSNIVVQIHSEFIFRTALGAAKGIVKLYRYI